MGLNSTMARLQAEHQQSEKANEGRKAKQQEMLNEMRGYSPNRWKTEREQVIEKLERTKLRLPQVKANYEIILQKVADYQKTLEGAKKGVERAENDIAELQMRLDNINILLKENNVKQLKTKSL